MWRWKIQTRSAPHFAQSGPALSLYIHPSTHPSTYIHTYRAIFRRQSSASSNDTTIPLDNIGESVWWLQFIGKDWKSLKIKSLETTLSLGALLAALGAQTNDDNNDDGAASTLCLAPGPGQLL